MRRNIYPHPADRHAHAIQETLVRRDDGPVREHLVPRTRQALDCRVAGDWVLHAAAVRARIVRGAVVLEGAPLAGVEAWRKVAGGRRAFERA